MDVDADDGDDEEDAEAKAKRRKAKATEAEEEEESKTAAPALGEDVVEPANQLPASVTLEVGSGRAYAVQAGDAGAAQNLPRVLLKLLGYVTVSLGQDAVLFSKVRARPSRHARAHHCGVGLEGAPRAAQVCRLLKEHLKLAKRRHKSQLEHKSDIADPLAAGAARLAGENALEDG
jgi:hypothetical protein